MNNLINPFTSTEVKINWYCNCTKIPKYKIGDYCIYKHGNSYVYAYKNLAFNELAAINIEHLTNVASRIKPASSQMVFLYERAISTLERNLHLIN